MFNYTSQTLLNDLSRVEVITGGTSANQDPGVEATKLALYIKRLGKFVVGGTNESIKGSNVYKTPAAAPSYATATFTNVTGATTANTVYRINVSITTNGYPNAQYARDRVLTGKPFNVEVFGTSSLNATSYVNAWNKATANYTDFIKASTNNTTLVLTAQNPYIKFESVTISSIDYSVGSGTNGNETVLSLTPTLVAGSPGYGTWDLITANLRLPTTANYRPYGVLNDQLPIVGATYDQYSFVYDAAAGVVGNAAVGLTGTKQTTHVIFVKTGLTAVKDADATPLTTGTYSFDQLLETAGLTITNALTGANINPADVTEA